MKKEGVKKYILGFMYAERLKSALIIAGQLLNGLEELDEKERSAGLKIFAFFVEGVTREMKLAASVMEDSAWHGLSGQFSLVESYIRLGQEHAARKELSRSLSRVTTLAGRAMVFLEEAGLL